MKISGLLADGAGKKPISRSAASAAIRLDKSLELLLGIVDSLLVLVTEGGRRARSRRPARELGNLLHPRSPRREPVDVPAVVLAGVIAEFLELGHDRVGRIALAGGVGAPLLG